MRELLPWRCASGAAGQHTERAGGGAGAAHGDQLPGGRGLAPAGAGDGEGKLLVFVPVLLDLWRRTFWWSQPRGCRGGRQRRPVSLLCPFSCIVSKSYRQPISSATAVQPSANGRLCATSCAMHFLCICTTTPRSASSCGRMQCMTCVCSDLIYRTVALFSQAQDFSQKRKLKGRMQSTVLEPCRLGLDFSLQAGEDPTGGFGVGLFGFRSLAPASRSLAPPAYFWHLVSLCSSAEPHSNH